MFVPGVGTTPALVEAIKVGAGAEVTKWLGTLQPDDRGSEIAHLGGTCQPTREVQRFFLDAAASQGEKFWTERWYRGIVSCRVPEVQALLSDKVAKGPSGDQARFLGILEAYARNLGGAAVPKLKEMAVATKDGEQQTYLVNAMADAAGVGSAEGPNAEAATAAIKAIQELAPDLENRALEQARTTLNALGDERASDELAGHRFKAAKRDDGTIRWGAVAVETATCKNAKVTQVFHMAAVVDEGRTWPDQLQERVATATASSWAFDVGPKCKGESKVAWTVSGEPFADDAAFRKWVEDQSLNAQRAPADKRLRVEHDDVRL
jgi:hypothetical protein